MQIKEGPILIDIHGLPTVADVQEEFDKLKELLHGRRLTHELQQYVFSELVHALTKKINISSSYLPAGLQNTQCK